MRRFDVVQYIFSIALLDKKRKKVSISLSMQDTAWKTNEPLEAGREGHLVYIVGEPGSCIRDKRVEELGLNTKTPLFEGVARTDEFLAG